MNLLKEPASNRCRSTIVGRRALTSRNLGVIFITATWCATPCLLAAQPATTDQIQEVQEIVRDALDVDADTGWDVVLIDARARTNEDDQHWRKALGVEPSGKVILDLEKLMLAATIHAPKYRQELGKLYKFGVNALRQAQHDPAMLAESRKAIAMEAQRFDSFRQQFLASLIASLDKPESSFISLAFMDERARQLTMTREQLKIVLARAESLYEGGQLDRTQVSEVQRAIHRASNEILSLERQRSHAEQQFLGRLGLPPDLRLELKVPEEWQAHILPKPIHNQLAARIGKVIANQLGNQPNKKQLVASMKAVRQMIQELEKEHAAITELDAAVKAALKESQSRPRSELEAETLQSLERHTGFLREQTQTNGQRLNKLSAAAKQLSMQLDEADAREFAPNLQMFQLGLASAARSLVDLRSQYIEVEGKRRLLLLSLPATSIRVADAKALGRARNPWLAATKQSDPIEQIAERGDRMEHMDHVERVVQLSCEEMERLSKWFPARKNRLAAAFDQVALASLEFSQPIAASFQAPTQLHPFSCQKWIAACADLHAADLALTDALFRNHAAEFQLFGALRAFQFHDGRWNEQATRKLLRP